MIKISRFLPTAKVYPPKIIGIYSPVMQSGKTTTANYLCANYNFSVKPFARPMKEMIRTFFNTMGFPPEVVEQMLTGNLKDQPIVTLDGKTPRDLMLSLGTDWGRGMVADDVWVKANLMSIFRDTVIDDVRFPNEYDAIKAAGGEVWCVVRGDPYIKEPAPEGEGRLDDYVFDKVIYNSGTIAQLRAEIATIMMGLN